MRNLLGAALAVFISLDVFAVENSKLIECSAQVGGHRAVLTIDSVGHSVMTLRENQNASISSVFSLKSIYKDDKTGAVISQLIYRFQLFKTDPDLDAGISKSIAKTITLKVFTRDQQITRATLRWLAAEQPQACQITTGKLSDARFEIRKWKTLNKSDRH